MEAALKILYPVVIDGTETVKWTDTAGLHEETLTAGTYYLHDDASNTDYPSLFAHIIDVMDAAADTGYSFAIEAVTPTASDEQYRAGVRIKTTNPSLSWSYWRNGTINLGGYLGHAFQGGSVASSGGIIDGPYTYGGSWIAPDPPDLFGSRPLRVLTPSTEHVERDDAYWFDQGSRRIRELRFDLVAAAHVYADRALTSSAYATAAALHENDRFNALETAWEALAPGGTAILCFYADREDLDLGVDDGGRYEYARLVEPDQMQDFGNLLRMVRSAGELYEVSMSLARIGNDFTWRF